MASLQYKRGAACKRARGSNEISAQMKQLVQKRPANPVDSDVVYRQWQFCFFGRAAGNSLSAHVYQPSSVRVNSARKIAASTHVTTDTSRLRFESAINSANVISPSPMP